MINCIQNICFCLHNIFVCTVYYVYINTHTHNTHTCIYLRKICYVYILNIFIYDINYIISFI